MAIFLTVQFPPHFLNQLSAQDSPAQLDEPAWDVVELIELSTKRDVWSPPRTLQLLGEIKRFESEQLDLIDRDGSERTVPSKYVLRVVPHWRTAEAAQAHQ
ncbi:MAG: hypothetical protein KDA51_04415, partial [Planctomycetales bacterium]|nr:hypothetical protein [Planctomycetales bacterium]